MLGILLSLEVVLLGRGRQRTQADEGRQGGPRRQHCNLYNGLFVVPVCGPTRLALLSVTATEQQATAAVMTDMKAAPHPVL